jgi:Zn-dependent peptidase ImmA (M78 family)
MSEFTKEVLDRVVFAAYRHVPQFLLVSKQARVIYQKVMVNIADREWREAEKRAEQLSAPYTSPPIPVLEIAEQNGVNVVFADFGSNAERVAGLCDFENARIYVNQEETRERQAFTMAHELGHWILHKQHFIAHPDQYPVLPRFSQPDQNDPLEKEANKFAACLLVPARLLRPVREAPISYLASVFGVSQTMMEFRLKNV